MMISHVSDTAFMVAAWRGQENERPDALFRDAFSARLAGEEGRRILQHLPRGLFFSGWSVVIRTRIIDHFIRQAYDSGITTILNLGAGLDARPYRPDFPAGLHWIEVDYPVLIDLKEKRLEGATPHGTLERVRLDLSDRKARQALFQMLGQRFPQILVLTEGVTPYLLDEDVGSLAEDLRQQPAFHYWIVDYFSPATYAYRQRKDIQRVMKQAPFRFQPRDYFGFFAAHGWRKKDMTYIPEEGERLGRPMPHPLHIRILLKLLGRFIPPARLEAVRHFSGFVLFKPT